MRAEKNIWCHNMTMTISSHNARIFSLAQFLYACVFTIPIWIAFYQMRVSISSISILVALQYASQLVFELPTGAFADLVGRKATIVMGYGLWVIATLLVVITTGFLPLCIAAILGGLAESLLSGSLEAIVYDSYKQDGREAEFGKVLSQNGILFQFGLAIGTLSGGFLYAYWDALPYYLYAIFLVGATIVSSFMIEPKIDSEHFSLSSYVRQIRQGTHHAFRSRSIVLISLFYIAVASITWTNNLYFFDFMILELGFTPEQRSILGAVLRIFNVLVLRSLLQNDHIFTRGRSIRFFPVAMTVGFFGASLLAGYPLLAVPFIALAVMAGTARWIVLTKYTNEVFESKYRATAISALSMIIGIIYIAITLISGPIIEHLGGVQTIYILLGVLTLIFVVPLSFMVISDTKEKKVNSDNG